MFVYCPLKESDDYLFNFFFNLIQLQFSLKRFIHLKFFFVFELLYKLYLDDDPLGKYKYFPFTLQLQN